MVNRAVYSCILILMALNVYAAQPDWSKYDTFLQANVVPRTVNDIPVNFLNYQATLQGDLFSEVVAIIETFPTSTLISRDEKLAFYINAYNIMAIKVVRDHWPLKSIKDAGGWFTTVWHINAGKINGDDISLDEIEHTILRPMGDPRIHFAIVCASLSCPDLRTEAFNIKNLDDQLNDQVEAFLQNSRKGLKVEGNTAKVSKIFGWFEEDFSAKGGIDTFIKGFGSDFNFTQVKPDLSYDWSLNGG